MAGKGFANGQKSDFDFSSRTGGKQVQAGSSTGRISPAAFSLRASLENCAPESDKFLRIASARLLLE